MPSLGLTTALLLLLAVGQRREGFAASFPIKSTTIEIGFVPSILPRHHYRDTVAGRRKIRILSSWENNEHDEENEVAKPSIVESASIFLPQRETNDANGGVNGDANDETIMTGHVNGHGSYDEEEEEEEDEELKRDKEMMRQAIFMAHSSGGERGSQGPFPRPICGAVLVAKDGRVSHRNILSWSLFSQAV